LLQPSAANAAAVAGATTAATLPPCSRLKAEAAEPITLASSASPPVTLIMLSARITVTVLASTGWPASTCSGGQGLCASFSAKHRL
jgi:hypothetical protein